MVEAYAQTVADSVQDVTGTEVGKKKSYHHGDLRNAIILEATARARVSGEKAIVLREIAPQIGVSATAAYRHFTNRQQLVEEVSARGFEMMRERLTSLESMSGTVDPVLAAYVDLRNAAITIVEFALAEPAWARMMLENLGSSQIVAEKGMAAREVMQAIVDRGVQSGTFSPGLRLDSQRALWAAIDGLSAQAMFGVHPMDTPDAVEAISRTIDLCMTDMLTERALEVVNSIDLPTGIVAAGQI